MKIISFDFKNNNKIPIRFTGDGENINPNLAIEGIPTNTKSLALIVDDPDAPSGTWVHWIIFNIPIKDKKLIIREDSILGIQGKNSWGRDNYGGPKPPSGTHRYFFRIYALDCLLNLREGTSREELRDAIEAHVLDEAELIGLYR